MARQCENRAEAARAHGPLVNSCRKIVLRGAGKHVGAIHERESPLMSAPSCGLPLCRVKVRVRVVTESFGHDRMHRLSSQVESDIF